MCGHCSVESTEGLSLLRQKCGLLAHLIETHKIGTPLTAGRVFGENYGIVDKVACSVRLVESYLCGQLSILMRTLASTLFPSSELSRRVFPFFRWYVRTSQSNSKGPEHDGCRAAESELT